MEFLRIENLCKVYGREDNEVTALDHVSVVMVRGEFVFIFW